MQTALIMYIGFWNAHVLHMLYSIAFPFEANHFMTSHSATKRVHYIEVFVIMTLALLGSTINISTTGYRFIGFSRLCVITSLTSFFYSYLVPIATGCSIGVLMLCSLVLIVRKVSLWFKM